MEEQEPPFRSKSLLFTVYSAVFSLPDKLCRAQVGKKISQEEKEEEERSFHEKLVLNQHHDSVGKLVAGLSVYAVLRFNVRVTSNVFSTAYDHILTFHRGKKEAYEAKVLHFGYGMKTFLFFTLLKLVAITLFLYSRACFSTPSRCTRVKPGLG